MNDSPRHVRGQWFGRPGKRACERGRPNQSQRAGALALLAGFVAALLLGAFHPLGLTQHADQHVCHGDEQHADADHDHHHDAATCSFCHLAHEVKGDRLLDGPTQDGPAPLIVDAPQATPASRPDAPCLPGFRSRAPPAA